MSNQLEQLLEIWYQDKDKFDWVLATVVETAGSSYRKTGAMMFINDLGKYYGLISGGCLESDLMRQARQCFGSNGSKIVCYDMREDDDLGWQLGIGCGGMVKLLVQPITSQNQYLDLIAVRDTLKAGQSCQYCQIVSEHTAKNYLVTEQTAPPSTVTTTPTHFIHQLSPAPLFAIFGGGVDARPLCEMAYQLGWHVIVIDERVGYARAEYFINAQHVFKQTIENVAQQNWFKQLDAIAIMTHNVQLDARVLNVVQQSDAKFIGLLGPTHRTEKVLNAANLSYKTLAKPLSNPIGLDIGGELPESIALSILSEAHAVLAGKLNLENTERLQHVS